MENLLQKNLEFMEAEMPQLYKTYLRKIEEAGEEQKPVEYTETSGCQNLMLNGKPVHSRYNAEIDGKIMSMLISDEDYDTIFIFGMGMGHHIREICSSYPSKNKIFFEPNFSAFCEFLKKQDLKELYQKNVMFVLEDTKQNILDSLIHLFSTFVIYKVTFIGLPTYISEYYEDWTHITKGYVDFYMRYSVNLKTLIRYNNAWMVNFFKNLRQYPFESEFDDYKEKFMRVPGIIVSSGPSLKKNMHLLKGVLDKAVVVSAGSSINALEVQGIIPHIMLAVDGSQLMSDEYNAVKDTSILFAHILNVHYDCIEKYQGPKLHFKVSSEMNIEYFEKVGSFKSTTIGSGGSCANVAMDFLAKMGCNPIILIGQDLCFTGNVTHSEGVWDRQELTDKIIETEGKDLIKRKDVFGRDVFTNRVFSTIHKWFEDYIRANEMHKTGLNVVNATEGGLVIEGAEHISFQEAIDKYLIEDQDISKRLMGIHKESLLKELHNKRIVKNFLMVMEKEFKKLEKMSRERYGYLEDLLKRLRNGNTDVKDLMKKINKVTEKLEKNQAFNYVIWVQSFEMIYNIKNASEIKAKSEKHMIDKLKVLYGGLEQQFNEIHLRIKVINELIQDMKDKLQNAEEWKDAYENT